MTRREILDLLNAEAPGLRRKYAVRSLAVIGSMARGDDREGSDVDILATFEGPASFDNFMGLKLDLEDRFGRRVDRLCTLTPVQTQSGVQSCEQKFM